MTQVRPFVPGPVNVTGRMPQAHILQDDDSLEVAAGGVVYQNGQSITANVTRTLGIQSSGPRDGLPVQDKSGLRIICTRGGLWTCGTEAAQVDGNPERLSPLYRTRVIISYDPLQTTGAAPVVDQIVLGSTGLWRARVRSVNVGANTAELSLFAGAAAGAGAETLAVEGSPGDSWGGVSVGASAGVTTKYNDLTGEKAPYFNVGGQSSGYYNCIGQKQENLVGTHPNRFPPDPKHYSKSFKVPKAEFGRGAVLEIVRSGVWFNNTPHPCTLYDALNIGEAIFTTQGLGANNHRARMRFHSSLFPVSPDEVPFISTIRMTASRKSDRTEGNIAINRFESELHSYIVGLQRGSDKLVGGTTTFTGFEFENGDDNVAKRTKRNVAVWSAVGTDLAPGPATRGVASSGSFYVNFHTFQVRLYRGIF